MLLDRLPVQADRVRVLQPPRAARQRTGRSEPDCAAFTEVVLGCSDHSYDGVENRAIVTLRRRHSPPRQLTSDFVERDDFDLGPPEIDSQAQHFLSSVGT